MRVIDGKIIFANNQNVGVAHFDKPNMEEKVSVIVLPPTGQDINLNSIEPGFFNLKKKNSFFQEIYFLLWQTNSTLANI